MLRGRPLYERALGGAERKCLTCSSASSHRAYERPYGLYVSGTRIDFGRPICIDPTHCCDGSSDHSRLARTRA